VILWFGLSDAVVGIMIGPAHAIPVATGSD
jgi:hypothetical protein